MAYVLGYFYADGSLENASYIRGKYVRVTSTDKDRIEVIRKLLQSKHTIVEEKGIGNRKTRFLLRIGNHVLYNRLTQLGMTPNKSLTMQFPQVPLTYLSPFMRGYFDGDGCVFLEEKKGKTQAKIIKRLSIIFTSGSKEFLIQLQHALARHADVSVGHLYQGTRAYQLHYFTKDSVRLFSFMYKGVKDKSLYMRRKYDIFKGYFKKRPERADVEVRRVLRLHARPRSQVVRRFSAKEVCAGAIPAVASRIK